MILKLVKFNLRILYIGILLFLLLLGVGYFSLKDPNKFKSQVLRQVNRRIDGDLSIGKLKWIFRDGRLGVNLDSFVLNDKFGVQIINAKNNDFLFNWNTLFSGFRAYEVISSENMKLSLSKDEKRIWNFEKVLHLDPNDRKGFSLKKLDVANCDFKLEDYLYETSLEYPNLVFSAITKKREFSKDNKIDSFFFNISSHKDDLDNSQADNFFKINGYIDSHKRWHKRKADLNVDIRNLDLALLRSVLEDFNDTKAIKSGIFTANASLRKNFKKDLSLNGKLSLLDFTFDPKYIFDISFLEGLEDNKTFRTKLAEHPDLIKSAYKKAELNFNVLVDKKKVFIENLKFDLDKFGISLDGEVVDWDKKKPFEPNLALNFQTDAFDYRKLLSFIPEKFLSQATNRHLQKYSGGRSKIQAKVQGTPSNFKPSFKLSLSEVFLNMDLKVEQIDNTTKQVVSSSIQRVNMVQGLSLNLDVSDEGVKLSDFVAPVGLSNIYMEGSVDKSFDSYKFDLKAKDLPVDRVLLILKGLPIRSIMGFQSRAFDMNGFASFNLDFLKEKDKPLEITGDSKFGQINFRSKLYPIKLNNLYGNLKFNNEEIVIDHILGYLKDDYFEILGKIVLDKLLNIDLGFASKKLNLKNLIESKAFDFHFFNELKLAEGNLISPKLFLQASFLPKQDDLCHAEEKPEGLDCEVLKSFDFSGSSGFEQVSLSFDEAGSVLSIPSGEIIFSKGEFKTSKLNLSLDESLISMDGDFSEFLREGDYSLKADNLDLGILAKFFADLVSYKLVPPSWVDKLDGFIVQVQGLSGKLNIDLNSIKDELVGFIDLLGINSELDIKTKVRGIDISSLTGVLNFQGSEMSFDSLSGVILDSDFNLNGKIEDYIDPEKASWELNYDSYMLVDKAYPLMHRKFKKFFKLDGYMPSKIEIKGNKTKSVIHADLDLTELNSFKFSHWLEKDDGFEVRVDSTLAITPKSILSQKAEISIKREGLEPSKIYSNFQVKDPFKKEQMNFHSEFIAEPDSMLANIEPNISILDPLNLVPGLGDFRCNTFGNYHKQQTICSLNILDGVLQNYGIGDLNFVDAKLDILGETAIPTKTYFTVASGDWNTIPFENLEFDLSATKENLDFQDLSADVLNGEVWGNLQHNLNDLSSSFEFYGQKLPAHEVSEGLWGIGKEVPEGLVAGSFIGSTMGLEPDVMFNHLDAKSNMILEKGKLSKLSTAQKFLSAADDLDKGIFELDINTVLKLLFSSNEGAFDYIIAPLVYDRGKVSSERVLLKSSELELESRGYIDYLSDHMDIMGVGLINTEIKRKKQQDTKIFKFRIDSVVDDASLAIRSLKENFQWLKQFQTPMEEKK